MVNATSSPIEVRVGAARERRAELPQEFLRWQCESRLALVEAMRQGRVGEVRQMPSHLPAMATYGPEGGINLASKGLGLIPVEERLERYTRLFRLTVEGCRGRDWPSTLPQRADALMQLYSDPSNLDPQLLGGLEIFEGATYENLHRDPRAYLLYNGPAPDFISYQVDGEVEFVDEGDLRYDFLLAARELFANDPFHVHQVRYPYGLVLHVRAVRDKRPFTRRP
jgi:hypothetical protein